MLQVLGAVAEFGNLGAVCTRQSHERAEALLQNGARPDAEAIRMHSA
jgi:hypothetical protein